MGKEIELKLKIKNNSLEKIRDILKCHSKSSTISEIADEYFSANGSISNNFSLIRIRTKESDKLSNSVFTFKSKSKKKKGIWHRDEFETEVQNPSALKELFSALNLVLTRSNKSTREIFVLQSEVKVEIINYSLPVKLEMIEVEGESEAEVERTAGLIAEYTEKASEDIFKSFDEYYKDNPI